MFGEHSFCVFKGSPRRLRRKARSLCLLYTAVDGVVQCFDGGIQSVQEGFVAQFGLAAALNPVKVCPEKLDLLFGITLSTPFSIFPAFIRPLAIKVPIVEGTALAIAFPAMYAVFPTSAAGALLTASAAARKPSLMVSPKSLSPTTLSNWMSQSR